MGPRNQMQLRKMVETMSLKQLLAPLINLFRKPDPPKNWTIVEWIYDDNDEKEIHVLPNNDHIIHEIPSDHCPCGVHWERENGINLYTHHSLDGREKHE